MHVLVKTSTLCVRMIILHLNSFEGRLNLDMRHQQRASELSSDNRQQVGKALPHQQRAAKQTVKQTCCFTPSCCCRNAEAADASIPMPGAYSQVIRVARSVAMRCQKPLCRRPRCAAPCQPLQELL